MQLQLVRHVSGILLPATPQTTEILNTKIRPGAVLEADFRQVRNPLDVLWRWILSRAFKSHEEAENVAMQLMSYTG